MRKRWRRRGKREGFEKERFHFKNWKFSFVVPKHSLKAEVDVVTVKRDTNIQEQQKHPNELIYNEVDEEFHLEGKQTVDGGEQSVLIWKWEWKSNQQSTGSSSDKDSNHKPYNWK